MKYVILSSVLVFTLVVWLGNARGAPLNVGASAPVLTATDDRGDSVDFAKLYRRGLTLVYFFPKASTPGCTAQACSLRDSIASLGELGVTVVGVSHDTVEAQLKFKEKNGLPFTLIADKDGKVIEAFGVPTRVFGIAKRQSFLIRDGKIVWRSLSAQTGGHAEEVRTAIAALK